MTASPTPKSAILYAPVFTLGCALRWLGHDCPDHHCCEPIDVLNASVGSIPRVLVDPTETGTPGARIGAT
jgi:hypothetical protein